MTAQELVLGLLCMVAGAGIQTTIGFGAGLLAVPLLLLVNPAFVPGPVTVAGMFLNVAMLATHRAHTDWRGVQWSVLGLLPGTAVAALALAWVTGSSLAVLSGTAVLIAVGASAAGGRLPTGRRTLVGAGFFAGYLGTTAGVPGPPLALAYQHESPSTLRATLAPVFLVAAGLTLITLVATDHFDGGDLRTGLLLAPGGLTGFVLSRPLAGRVDGAHLRVAVLVISGLSAGAAILRALV